MKFIFAIVFSAVFAAQFYSCSRNEEKLTTDKQSQKKDSALSKDELSPVLRNSSVAGRYETESDKTSFREMNADGTFNVKDFGVEDKGTYTIDNNVINFKYVSGLITNSKFDKDKIIDMDGEVWMKK